MTLHICWQVNDARGFVLEQSKLLHLWPCIYQCVPVDSSVLLKCLLFLDKASVFIYDIISLNMCPRACLSSRIGTSIIVQAQTLKCFLLKWDNEQLVPSGFDGTKVPTYQPSISSTHSYGNTNWAGYRILGSWMMEVAKWSLTKFAKRGRFTTVSKGRQRSAKVGKGQQSVCGRSS